MRFSTSLISRRCLLMVFFLLPLLLAALAWSPATPESAEAKGPGAKTQEASAINPAVGGQWSPLIPFQTVPVHISLLPNGKILYWGRDKQAGTDPIQDVTGRSNTYVIDPQFFFNDPLTHTKLAPNTTTNLFCSGHSFLADGRLLVTGGHEKNLNDPMAEGLGDRAINFFDYETETWRKHPDPIRGQLALGRWYPYNVTLADGSVAILGGSYWVNRDNPFELSDAENNPFPEKFSDGPTKDGNVAPYNIQTTLNPEIVKYPLAHLAHDGRVLLVGERNVYFDGNSSSASGPLGYFAPYPGPPFGEVRPNNSRWVASSVLYEVTYEKDAVNSKVLVVGGSERESFVPEKEAHINVTNTPQLWTTVGAMAYKRKQHTTTLLPDGKVLVTGGTQCPRFNNIDPTEGQGATCGGVNPRAVLWPELWDPDTGVWTKMTPNPSGVPRLYHSTALLLPDATVLVGGGGLPAADGEGPAPNTNEGRVFGHKNAEIFSPPYLFNLDWSPAERPVINWIQDDTIGLGQSMLVSTPNPADISSVVLVRLGSVTHQNNQDQRRVVLKFSNNHTNHPQTLKVMMPQSGKVCPPGPYMMFLLNTNGTPSVAKIVSVQLGPQSLDDPPLPSGGGEVLRSNPAVVRNQDGRLQVFYRGGDDALYTMAQQTAGSANWTPPHNLGFLIYADPAAVLNYAGQVEILVVGQGGTIHHAKQTSPNSLSFSGFKILDGISVSNLALGKNQNQRLQVFFRAPDDAVWTLRQQHLGGDDWSNPMSLGGNTSDEPTVGRVNDRLTVFIKGTNNQLYYTRQTSPNVNSWSSFATVMTELVQSTPAVANNLEGSLNVLTRGPTSQLLSVTMFPPDKGWTPASLGGLMMLAPGVGANAANAGIFSNRLDVFVLGTGGELFYNRQTASGWTGFTLMNGSFSTPLNARPITGMNADGRLAVFVRGSDYALYMTTQTIPGGGYSGIVPVMPAPPCGPGQTDPPCDDLGQGFRGVDLPIMRRRVEYVR